MLKNKLKCLITCVAITSMMATTSYSVLAATVTPSSVSVETTSPIASVNAGSNWVVSTTTKLAVLTIGEGANITAPEGYSVTLTVNGVETAIEAGTYKGNIVLTVTKNIVVQYGNLDPEIFRTGIYINDGKYVADQSVDAAVVGGKVTDTYAKNVNITSNNEKFNGIIATGNSKYTIDKPVINLTGNGGNDVAGWGAAIMSSGNADVTVDHASINTKGCIRTAIFAGGNSIMHVNNSDIQVHDGTLPEGYTFNVDLGKMMEVPWMLGLTGTCRATNLVGKATAYYTNDHIVSEGWGALSTDDNEGVKLYAKDCIIETLKSGYGAYSIGDNSVDTFDACKLNVADMGMIMANGNAEGIFTNGTVVNSGRFGVMVHGGNTGTLTIDKGSVFNTEKTAIQVKSSAPTIVVDNAKLNSKSGVILQAMVNDDPMMPQSPGGVGTVNATFKNTTLNGDIVNSMTTKGAVNVTFNNATIKGAITTATATAAGTPSIDAPYYIGDVINTYCATNNEYGVTASLDADSNWVVDKTSYLTGLTIADGAKITAPEGYKVTMTVNGAETNIAAGTYNGVIVLTVTQIAK